MKQLATYIGLEGVRRGKLRGSAFESSITGMMRGLRSDRVCSIDGTRGTLTVWRDDAGRIRCVLAMAGRIVSSEIKSSQRQVRAWAKSHEPRIWGAA